MIVDMASAADIQQVVWRMRPESAIDAYASLPHDDPAILTGMLQAAAATSTRFFALRHGVSPAALVGLSVVAPGRGAIVFLATADFPAIGRATHRWWHRHFVPGYLMRLRRVSFTGYRPDTPTGRWYRSFGFECEGIARAHGKDGRDFAHWAWINPNWQRLTAPAGG